MRLLIVSLTIALAACSSQAEPQSEPVSEVVVVTHDSFAVSQDVLDEFTRDSGLTVKIVQNGDAGQVVNSAILSAGAPQGDVLFGVDNTFLSRAQEAGVFVDYQASGAPAALAQDAPGVTPIDTGAVCLNYDTAYFANRPAPDSPADLIDSQYRDLAVVQNPATSSPGLAFLLSTVATQQDWQQYWRDLKANGVKVVDGWDNAYYRQFSGGSGEGDRPIVVSYSTSPAAEVMFSEDPAAPPPTANVDAQCFQAGGIRRGPGRRAQRVGGEDVRGLHVVEGLPGRHRRADVRLPGDRRGEGSAGLPEVRATTCGSRGDAARRDRGRP